MVLTLREEMGRGDVESWSSGVVKGGGWWSSHCVRRWGRGGVESWSSGVVKGERTGVVKARFSGGRITVSECLGWKPMRSRSVTVIKGAPRSLSIKQFLFSQPTFPRGEIIPIAPLINESPGLSSSYRTLCSLLRETICESAVVCWALKVY